MNHTIEIKKIQNGFLVKYTNTDKGYFKDENAYYCKTLSVAEIYIRNTLFPVIHAKKKGK